jgi:RNA polymerase sigma factor (sigma-70 family)
MGQPTDKELFAELFEHSRPRLQTLLRLYGVAPEDREDLVQEALLALWRKRFQIENQEAWLLRAVRVECLRYRRRVRRQIHTVVEEPVLEVLAGSDDSSKTDFDLRQDLRAMVRRLPARHRALIHLRYELGLTPEETASLLGYRLSSLKKTTTRCLHTLRRDLLSRGPVV